MASEEATTRAEITVDGEPYGCRAVRWTERLDAVPRVVAVVTRDGALPRPTSLLGAAVEVKVTSRDLLGASRLFRGVVTGAERRVGIGEAARLELVVEPELFRLGRRTDLRTFLDRKVDEIIAAVFDGAGLACAFELGESYPPRPNVIQYRETDLDFVLRLCAEEGIAMTWDHEEARAVFFDDPRGRADAEDAVQTYVPEFGFGQTRAAVQKASRVHQVVTDKVHLRQYDFEKPRALVEQTKESADDGAHALEAYVFPARTTDPAAATRFAQVLLDAVQARRDVVRGRSSSWTLGPAQRFAIEGHPLEPMNEELLVIGVELVHEEVHGVGGAARLQTHLGFEAIPTSRSAYRPERRPRAAGALAGAQLATTTGASGEEIDVDGHGRVTARFPWDRSGVTDDKASVRMRTIQLPTGGSMLLPRVGWEVLVQCDEGDVDVPLVVGRLYDGVKKPPYALPGGAVRSSLQTATTPGGGSTNELRTDDTKGREEMFFNASKDTTILVKNNTTESIGNDATLQVGADQTLEITNSLTTVVGADQTITVGGNEKVAVETFHVDQCGGDHSLTIGGNRDMKVGGDHRHTVGGAESVEVGGMKTDLVVGKISESTAGNLDLSIGAASVTLTPAGIALEAGGNHDESIGAAKIVVAFGGAGSEVAGTSMTQLVGAKVGLVDGDRAESAGGTYTSVAAGAQLVKADNVVFEAEATLSLVMGGSIIVLTPASVSLIGASAKLDGATAETAALVVDN